ncbi:hypothetical protein DM01DRAFT_1403887 [Hesseltinella vesiculosa]|uniref:Uncharacterized protein n=1 Tax=Hesseltinella vesiculosa TaxID=101127 RepID=A0A1X2GX63_9FUNG|nr:hypothetical protein DM01DRAFT_1403887 [Hesseltinella vesiculosa]
MNELAAVIQSPPPEPRSWDVAELAKTLRTRLQFARLKVHRGWTDKNLQQVEEELIPTTSAMPQLPPSPSSVSDASHESESMEKEAARTIMMLSSSTPPSPHPRLAQPVYMTPTRPRDSTPQHHLTYQQHQHGPPLYHHAHPSPFYGFPPSFNPAESQHPVNIPHDRPLSDHKKHKKHSTPVYHDANRVSQHHSPYPNSTVKNYTAPRRGRPRKNPLPEAKLPRPEQISPSPAMGYTE